MAANNMPVNIDAMAEAQVETVIVAVDDILTAFKHNRRDSDRERSHVLYISPPFDGEHRASLYVTEDNAHIPSEMTPRLLLLRPEAFVADTAGRPERTDITIPTLDESRRSVRDEHGGEADEASVEARHRTAMEEWEERVRRNLRDEVRVAHDPRTGDEVWADVRYE